ncbi:MAG TPA: carbon monoxide dehydrogenase [Gammaproteobacteria bacterium]|mgnify:CR=1 FL=1|nr:carbon monoxide dehydrogenase [Gammaproteobacteria bacterium]HAT29017.1 carbon monoxide dehydrogenase [Gammaproteobacteria bacterium]|tara:strand:- start:3 stop:809 length:807 start_codon:yes stop_codon:yes gene_type:complete
MYDFSYHNPDSVADAVSAMNKAEDGKFVAGGQTMLPTMKHRLASPSDIIVLGGITELSGITVDGDSISIGAMTTHAEVAASSDVQAMIPALAALAGNIGDPAVRNCGTIGGSVANNDPAADYPAAVIALGARVKTSKREISADDFFTGMFETALDDDELITAIVFPKATAAAYMKFENPASRYAIVGVFVARTEDGVRVGITGATHCAHRGMRLEAELRSKFSSDACDDVEIPVEKMNADIHASAEYRAHLVKVMAKRAVAACLGSSD